MCSAACPNGRLLLGYARFFAAELDNSPKGGGELTLGQGRPLFTFVTTVICTRQDLT